MGFIWVMRILVGGGGVLEVSRVFRDWEFEKYLFFVDRGFFVGLKREVL